MKSRPPGGGDLWVFGYGSLMWNPGFAHAEARPARVYGYHRAFCLYSEHYRGTEARPGLVLGLNRGGSCRGRAFRVPAHDADAAMEYLIAREMYGHEVDVYQLQWHRVALEGGMGGTGNTGGASGTGSTGNPGGTGGAACGSKGHRAGGWAPRHRCVLHRQSRASALRRQTCARARRSADPRWRRRIGLERRLFAEHDSPPRRTRHQRRPDPRSRKAGGGLDP